MTGPLVSQYSWRKGLYEGELNSRLTPSSTDNKPLYLPLARRPNIAAMSRRVMVMGLKVKWKLLAEVDQKLSVTKRRGRPWGIGSLES